MNNFGGVRDWPYRTYPEFLQRFLRSSGFDHRQDGGIAGEVSPNGLGQVRDYLDLFPNARYFIVGYGTNDLGMWPQVEWTSPGSSRTSPRWCGRPGTGGGRLSFLTCRMRTSRCSRRVARGSAPHEGLPQRASDEHCLEERVRSSILLQGSGMSISPMSLHPNDEGAQEIATEVFRVLSEVRRETASPSVSLLKHCARRFRTAAVILSLRGPRWTSLPLIVTIAFSIVGVIGDYFLKLASEQHSPLKSGTFYLGFIVYASTAFGWVYVMRHLKLATIGAVYSVSMILLLTSIGAIVFRQPLNAYEVVGLAMAIGSLILLMRFA